MNYTISEIQKSLSPNPFALLTSTKPDGKTNIMAISWWTFVSNNPPTVLVCLSQKGYSSELLRENREFALNFVNQNLKDAGIKCGTCSGRKVDKPEEFHIDLTEASEIHVKLVAEYKAALECRVTDIFPISDHVVFSAQIVETHLHPEQKALYAFDGYRRLDIV